MNEPQLAECELPEEWALPDVYFHNGRLFLNYCRRCHRANHPTAIYDGFCFWCDWNSPYEKMLNKFLGREAASEGVPS